MEFLLRATGAVLQWAAGVVMVFAWPVLPIAGFYLKACSDDPLGWAFVAMLAVAAQAPFVAIVHLCLAVLFVPLLKPFRNPRAAIATCKWWAISTVGVGLLVWLLAHAFDGRARCSLLW